MLDEPWAAPTSSAQRVAIVGLGYVGLPVAVRAVDVGYDVVAFDLDKKKVSALAAGESYIDDVDDADLRRVTATGRFHPTDTEDELNGFDIAVIAVPTPLHDGAPDVSYIEAAAQTLGRRLSPGALVVLESTTFPGTTEEVVGPILADESGLVIGTDVLLGYSPERIDPGNQVWNFVSTPKVVSGVDARSLAAVEAFYGRLVDTVVPVSGTMEAELTKLLENTFRHVNIALVNELAMHARSLGIDFWEVVEAADTKPFGFMAFRPGPGVGGHCLPVDPTFLSWRIERRLGTASRFVKIANEVNTEMPAYVVNRIQAGLNERYKPVKGSHIVVLGFAYKPNSNDARETPVEYIVQGLVDLGAIVEVVDAHVLDPNLPPGVELVDLTAERLVAADAVVLLTDHDGVDYDLVVEQASYVFDARNRLGPSANVEVL